MTKVDTSIEIKTDDFNNGIVKIDFGEVSLDSEAKMVLDDAKTKTEELIKVLNFDYIPLFEGTKGLRIANQDKLRPGKVTDSDERKKLAQELYGIQEWERTDVFKLLTRYMEEEVGGNMKFDNPLVWMMYKYFAYQKNELGAKPIRTIGDLIAHCASRDYICTKRFHFINRWLNENGFKSLRDKDVHGPDTDLSEIFTNPEFIKIAKDKRFMSEWDEYEKMGKESTEKWVEYKDHLADFPQEATKKAGENTTGMLGGMRR